MVWAVDGDGCFQMTAQELVTAAAERIPVKIAILNNAYLGMVRQWQEMFYEERYSEVYLSPDLPDYKMWAEAMGCVGMRVESPEEVLPAIEKANAIDDRPVVIDFRTDAAREGVPHGGRRRVQLRHPGRPGEVLMPTTRRQHILSVLVENKPGVLARRVEPVRPAGLQHPLAGGCAHRRRAVQPHHHRRRRGVAPRSSRSSSSSTS